jgi:hypothetical protein
MGMTDVADRGNLRLSDGPQPADLTRHTHAHLQNGYLMLRGQLQEHQGKADEVIPIALGLQDLEPLGKDKGGHLFGRSFPVAAGYRHYWQGVSSTPGTSEVPEGWQNLLDLNEKFPRSIVASCVLQPATLHQGAGGSFGHGLFYKVMAIEFPSWQGNKKLPSVDLAGIGANAHGPGKRIGTQKFPSCNPGNFAGG